jgi:hypothetical protein
MSAQCAWSVKKGAFLTKRLRNTTIVQT